MSPLSTGIQSYLGLLQTLSYQVLKGLLGMTCPRAWLLQKLSLMQLRQQRQATFVSQKHWLPSTTCRGAIYLWHYTTAHKTACLILMCPENTLTFPITFSCLNQWKFILRRPKVHYHSPFGPIFMGMEAQQTFNTCFSRSNSIAFSHDLIRHFLILEKLIFSFLKL